MLGDTHTPTPWYNNTALFANPPELLNKPEFISASDSLPLFCAQSDNALESAP